MGTNLYHSGAGGGPGNTDLENSAVSRTSRDTSPGLPQSHCATRHGAEATAAADREIAGRFDRNGFSGCDESPGHGYGPLCALRQLLDGLSSNSRADEALAARDPHHSSLRVQRASEFSEFAGARGLF